MISFVNTCKTCLPGRLLHQQFFRIRGEIRSYISAIKLCAIALPRSAVQVGYMGVATTPRNSNCQLEQDWRLQCPKRYGEILSSVGSRAQIRDPGERVRLDRGNRIASDGLLGAAV